MSFTGGHIVRRPRERRQKGFGHSGPATKLKMLTTRESTLVQTKSRLSSQFLMSKVPSSVAQSREKYLPSTSKPSSSPDVFQQAKDCNMAGKEVPRIVSFKRKGSSSQYKGVLYVKSQRKWRAQVCLKGRKKYVGSFETEIEAAVARDATIKELFGEKNELLNFKSMTRPNHNVSIYGVYHSEKPQDSCFIDEAGSDFFNGYTYAQPKDYSLYGEPERASNQYDFAQRTNANGEWLNQVSHVGRLE